MSHFVGNDVGVGEVAVSAELLLHGAEEGEVDIDALVGGAVEGAGGGGGAAAARLHAFGEEHKFGRHVGLAHLLELGGPHVFGAGENLSGELGEFLLLRGRLVGGFRFRAARQLAVVDDIRGVFPQNKADDADDDGTADAHTGDLAAASATTVIYVAAFSSS